MSLTLYVDNNYLSPWAMCAYVALVEKKLPFTIATIDIDAGEACQPVFSGLALTARVPALVHDGFVLTESTAIVEYLDTVYPAPDWPALLPADVRERARARQIQAWVRSDLQALRQERDTTTVFGTPSTQPLSAAGRVDADKLIAVAERLVSGPTLFERWCIADADLALMLNRLIHSGDPVPARLRDYAAAQWARDALRSWREQQQQQHDAA